MSHPFADLLAKVPPPRPRGTALYGEGAESSHYRYLLTRELDSVRVAATGIDLGTCLFIMLNPSTATATKPDPTITRCMGYARDWGYGSLSVCNLFAFRATDPKEIPRAICSGLSVVGPSNDFTINAACAQAQLTVCAWGSQGRWAEIRAKEVVDLLTGFELHALKLNADGQPAHPLYLKKSLKPFLWKDECPF